MWIYTGFIFLTAFQKIIPELEFVIILVVLVLIMAILFLIFRVYIAIQKSHVKHEIRTSFYTKQIELLYFKYSWEIVYESDFKQEQIRFYNTISELKSQWITLSLILFSLNRNQ